jgi:hypothetical protein
MMETIEIKGTGKMKRSQKKSGEIPKKDMVRLELKPDALKRLSEGQVLTLVAQEVELNNAGMNGKDVLCGWLQGAGVAGASRTHVRNACEGRTHIGTLAWMIIVRRSGTKLYDEWIEHLTLNHGL